MLQEIITAIAEDVKGLPFVERYGGLVRTANRVINIGPEEQPRMVRQAFPVACNVSELECWESGRYKDLVPNSRYKSLVYFEEIQPLTFAGAGASNPKLPKDIRMKFVAVVRLVAWLNMPELGKEDCSASAAAFGSFFKLFERINKTRLNLPFLATTNFQLVKQVNKNENIFARYTYDEKSNLLFYPFDTIGMDFQVSVNIAPHCLPELTPDEPIDCIDAPAEGEGEQNV